MGISSILAELDRLKRLGMSRGRDMVSNTGDYFSQMADHMQNMQKGREAVASGGSLGYRDIPQEEQTRRMVEGSLDTYGGGLGTVKKVAKIKGLPSLLSLRSATEEADAAIAAARSGGPEIIIKRPDGLRLLPKTDSPYIEADQFLPERQNPRTSGGVPVYNERTTDLIKSPAARKAIDRNIGRGDFMGMREWYGTNPLWEAAQQEGLSFDEFNRLMMHQANASQRSPVPGQIKRGSETWRADVQGELDENYKLPPGYGSLAQKQIIENALRIARGEGMDVTKKLGRFHQNLMGNLEPVTVDVMAMRGPIMATKDPRWLTREVRSQDDAKNVFIERPRQMYETGQMSVKEALQRPGFWEAAPQGAEYGAFEDMYRKSATRHGMRPAEAQATAWYGSGTEAGLRSHPMTYLQAVEERIFDTAAQRNETPTQVLSDWLRGRKSLGFANPQLLGGMALGGGGMMALDAMNGGEGETTLERFARFMRERQGAAQ